jgi:hypothetical protein
MATIENQYGRHMVQHVLFPVNIHFHWNLFIFEFLTIFEIFYIGGHFELAVILKILITKSTTLSDNLFLCQVSKGSAVRFEFNTFLHLRYHDNGHHFEFFSTPQKLPHTTVDILTRFHEVWWKESQIFFNTPFFVSMATTAKFVQPIPIFWAYLVPLDVDVVLNKFDQFLFGE